MTSSIVSTQAMPCNPTKGSLVDPAGDDLIALAELPQHSKAIVGREISTWTARQWASKGCRGIVLDSRLLGGVRFTSKRAVAHFLNQLAAL